MEKKISNLPRFKYQKIINAAGTYTKYRGSLVSPEII